MPSGDAQRAWFPEMLEELKTSWSRTLFWEELADFCALMTERRSHIRRERGIRPPQARCPKCGKVPRADIAGVSIRSALFALRNNGIITDDEFKRLDKSWMKHKQRNDLDAYGRRTASKSAVPENPCGDRHEH